MLPKTLIAFVPAFASSALVYKLNFAPANFSSDPFLILLISNGYVGVLASLGVVVVVSPGLLPYSNVALFFSVTTAFAFTFA